MRRTPAGKALIDLTRRYLYTGCHPSLCSLLGCGNPGEGRGPDCIFTDPFVRFMVGHFSSEIDWEIEVDRTQRRPYAFSSFPVGLAGFSSNHYQ